MCVVRGDVASKKEVLLRGAVVRGVLFFFIII